MVGAAGIDGKLAPQHKIMVGALAVVMPGNLLAISQREDTNLNVRAYGDGFHVLHLIVRHASRPKSPLAPMPRRNLLPVPPQPYSIAAGRRGAPPATAFRGASRLDHHYITPWGRPGGCGGALSTTRLSESDVRR